MAKRLKVWGGWKFKEGKQVSAVIATTSMKRVAEILGESLYFVRENWTETGNETDIELALKTPETVIITGRY